MKKSLVYLTLGSAITFAGNAAQAAPFNSFDPRSMAMGGAGVAVGNAATAPFFNPGLLAVTPDDDDFALELPVIGARFNDPDDFEGSVDDFQNDPSIFDGNSNFVLEQSINSADPANANSYRTVATEITNLSDGLTGVSDRNIQAEAGAGIVIGIPSKSFGSALSINGWGAIGGVFRYEDSDTLNAVSRDVDEYASCLEANQANPGSCNSLNLTYVDTDPTDDADPGATSQEGDILFDPNTDLNSSVDFRGILLTEVGLSMAREFEIGGQTMAVGITPKQVSATVIDYSANVNDDTDNFDSSDYTEEYTDFNIDAGVAKAYGNGWRTGLVLKNLIAQEYKTARGNTVRLNTQARIGVSHQNDWSTVALDVDLTENEPVDFGNKSRFVSLGAELNAFDWAQVRLGYRADTVDSGRNVASVGVGLSPFGIHVDVAAAKGANELGASAQLGFRF